jgi:hypothetical protein
MYTANKKIETFHTAYRQGHRRSWVLYILCLLLASLFYLTSFANVAGAATYYLDAVNGEDTNPGTSELPWKTLSKAQSEITDGDTVILATGDYGNFIEIDIPHTDWITYQAADGATVNFDSITIRKISYEGELSSYLIFRGIRIYHGAAYIRAVFRVRLYDCTFIGSGCTEPRTGTDNRAILLHGAEDVTIDGCTITGDGEGDVGYTSVSGIPNDGFSIAYNFGILFEYACINITINDCNIGGSNTLVSGISQSGITVSNCYLHHAAGDFITVNTCNTDVSGLTDPIIIEYNHLYAAYEYPATTEEPDIGWHNDGVQFNAVEINHVIIRGNKIHYTDGDAMYLRGDRYTTGNSDWLIENNLIYDTIRAPTLAVTQYTINMYNCDSCVFRNNTIVGKGCVEAAWDSTYPMTFYAFTNNIVNRIALGTATQNTVVTYENNNILNTILFGMAGYTWGKNTVILNSDETFRALFNNYGSNDFVLPSNSMAIDYGDPAKYPSTDILGVSRVFPPDAGCYEYIDPNTQSYSITASAGSGGQIIPSGTTQVVSGGSQAYTITANTGYQISDVVVDGSSVGNVNRYTYSYPFTNVTADHTIDATFVAIDTYTIKTSAGGGGTVSNPGEGQFSYEHGSEVSIEAMAYPNYHFVNWTGTAVDAGKVADPSDDSTKVTMDADYTIQANFAILPPDNKPPDISPIPNTLTKNEGETVTSAEVELAQDPDGETLTYTYSGWLTSLPYTTTYDDVGTHTLHVDVSDGTDTTGKNITITVTADTSAPSVANCAPADKSIQAPLNTLIILHVVDDGKGVDPESVTINVNDNLVYSGNTATHSSIHGKCHRIGTKANYTFIYQPKQNFGFDESVNVKVNAKDLADKPNPMAEYSYSFKTEMLSFGRNTRVDPRDVKKGRPVTVCDNSGNIWAAWHAGVADSRDIYIGKLLVDEEYFGSSVQLKSDAAECNPVTATGSDGKLYVAWQDNRNGNWDIYVSTSNDWSAEIRVTDSNDNQINPAIVVDSSLPNNAYIVWEDDRNGNQDIYVARSSNGFATKTVSPITSDTSDQVEPAIAADSGNTVYVVWTDTRNKGKNDIYGAASNNPWTNIPIVTEEESQSSPAIATEAVGSILHLVWVDDRTTARDDDIFYAKTTGGLSPLTGSSIIDDDTGADQISPVIITTGTGKDLKVFACWRDERNANADLYLAEISSDYSAKISSGDKANVFVGDDDTNSDQSEPAIGIDGDGHPYLVWTNERTDICYAGSTFIESKLASTNVSITSETTVGTMRNAIQSVDDVSAELPQGAYLCDVEVTISRIKNPPKFNFERFTGVYEFGPSGMEFTKPVTITIPYEVSGSENVLYKAYWYNSLTNTLSQEGITNIQTIVTPSGLHALRFKTTHFSPFIIGGVLGGLGGFFGGGGGGGCSMSPDSQAGIVELLLPYIGLTMAMVILKLRDRRKRETGNITKSEC